MTELWLVDLERAAPALEELEAAVPRLSPDDRRQVRHIGDLRARRHRLAAYAALRIALERMAGPGVRGARFVRSPAGKPSLARGRVAFSLSHSGGFALIGVTRYGAIGVDLEPTRNVRMSSHHQGSIVAAGRGLAAQGGGVTARPLAFLQAWSRLEAFAKADGRGLARLLADVGMRGEAGRLATPATIEASARQVAEATGLKVCDLKLPQGLFGAVALARPASLPRVRSFPVDRPAIARLSSSRGAPHRQR
jgi:4'-phosphopantetheinyl transferase